MVRKTLKKIGKSKKKHIAVPSITPCRHPHNVPYRYQVNVPLVLMPTITTGSSPPTSNTICSDDKPCRTKTEAIHLCALRALYVMFPLHNLSIQLPVPFRSLWKKWQSTEIKQQKQFIHDQHLHKITYVQELVQEWKTKVLPSRPRHVQEDKDENNTAQHWEEETKATNSALHRQDHHGHHHHHDNPSLRDGNRGNRGNQGNQSSSSLLKCAQHFQQRSLTTLYRKMFEKRMKDLPVMKHQQEVIANVVQSNAVVITGETGCGKSTQIPHVLLAAMVQRTTTTSGGSSASSAADKVGVPLGVPLGEIICTQPRRISATSLARRVSVEMGDTTPLDKQHSFVGYSIRGESRKSRNKMLTYCTTGILLRRLQSDPLLSNVSIVIVDEVHERTVQSDFLFIALRRLLSIRKSGGFKVLLMSATMDSQKVSRYFGNAPVLHIPGRTFPVSVQYLEDIIEATEFTYVGKNLLCCCCCCCCSPLFSLFSLFFLFFLFFSFSFFVLLV
jgi:ATP-dependent RNA helicase DHX29